MITSVPFLVPFSEIYVLYRLVVSVYTVHK